MMPAAAPAPPRMYPVGSTFHARRPRTGRSKPLVFEKCGEHPLEGTERSGIRIGTRLWFHRILGKRRARDIECRRCSYYIKPCMKGKRRGSFANAAAKTQFGPGPPEEITFLWSAGDARTAPALWPYDLCRAPRGQATRRDLIARNGAADGGPLGATRCSTRWRLEASGPISASRDVLSGLQSRGSRPPLNGAIVEPVSRPADRRHHQHCLRRPGLRPPNINAPQAGRTTSRMDGPRPRPAAELFDK